MHVMSQREMLQAELEELRRRHRSLDQQIDEMGEAARAALVVRRMKKQKLDLKDRIARIEDLLYPDIIA